MIQIQQLDIPGYIPLRKVRIENLKREAFHVPERKLSIRTRSLHFPTRDLLEAVIYDLANVLADDSCSRDPSFSKKLTRLMNDFNTHLDSDTFELAEGLGLLDNSTEMIEVGKLKKTLLAALKERLDDIVDELVDYYCDSLKADLERLNEYNLLPQRDDIRETIASELQDALSARAQISADESAMWILTNNVGAQVDVALALLKDGQTLVDAVAAAKAFQP